MEFQIYEEFKTPHRGLTIGDTNMCAICNKPYKYQFQKWKFLGTPEGLIEIRMKCEHPSCRNLIRKIDRLKDEILDLEFELFRKKN